MDGAADCLIVGGGAAGLTAAIYAARFYPRTVVIDEGESRAAPRYPDVERAYKSFLSGASLLAAG